MKKLLWKLFTLILCIGILAGGAYLSYYMTDFDAIVSDFNEVMAAPWISNLDIDFGGEETPDSGEETPDNGEETPDNGEETPDSGEETPDNSEQNPEGSQE